MRKVLALLVIAIVSSGCGASSELGAGGPGVDAPGILVFSGVPSGSYLHAIRPDGTGLKEIELPGACSPLSFSRDGRALLCYGSSYRESDYTVERRGTDWRRVPLPPEWTFPEWADEVDDSLEIDAPQWAPAGDRIALVRLPEEERDHWFSFTGDVAVANPDGKQERVVAKDGEVPTWSLDGLRLAFARCQISGEIPDESAECLLWVVSADEPKPAPKKLADKIDSAPVWSPDGRFVAFLRTTRPCIAACKSRIMAVPAEGGDPRPVGPELVEPYELYWLPDSASAVVAGRATVDDPLELQRCVDIWNRARMQWPKTAANVRLGEDGCQVTAGGIEIAGVFATGFECRQPVPYSYRCASHGENLRIMDPQQRVWNAEADGSAKLRLFNPPKGERLPLPKFPPHPMIDGYITPFDSKGELRPGLTVTKTVELEATCDDPELDDYPGRCYLVYNTCFRPPGPAGDVVLCPEEAGSTRFHRVKLTAPSDEPW